MQGLQRIALIKKNYKELLL